MNSREIKNFYALDEAKYDVKNNHKFLEWYNSLIDVNYVPFININDIENLINKLVTWYEIKYSDKQLNIEELEELDGLKKIDISYFNNAFMTFKDLLYRLSNKEYFIIKCPYRNIQNLNQSSKELPIDYNKDYSIFYDVNSNREIYLSIDMIINHISLKTDKLYYKLSELGIDNLDTIKKVIKTNEKDKLLREKILELVALKLLYSRNTIPERGLKRAEKFIKEFNHELKLHLNTRELDIIISKNYNYNLENKDISDDKLNSFVKTIKQMIKRISD